MPTRSTILESEQNLAGKDLILGLNQAILSIFFLRCKFLAEEHRLNILNR